VLVADSVPGVNGNSFNPADGTWSMRLAEVIERCDGVTVASYVHLREGDFADIRPMRRGHPGEAVLPQTADLNEALGAGEPGAVRSAQCTVATHGSAMESGRRCRSRLEMGTAGS
jgi:hypothetical protein